MPDFGVIYINIYIFFAFCRNIPLCVTPHLCRGARTNVLTHFGVLFRTAAVVFSVGADGVSPLMGCPCCPVLSADVVR